MMFENRKEESMLISDGNLAATLDEGGLHYDDYYGTAQDNSITKSYNQRIKEDTSYLHK